LHIGFDGAFGQRRAEIATAGDHLPHCPDEVGGGGLLEDIAGGPVPERL
jgi:hypothetical protein